MNFTIDPELIAPPLVEQNSDIEAALDVRAALARLPLTQRTVVVLHYYAGLSSAEIGSVTRQPAATVRFHLMRARHTLRALLSAADAGAQEHCQHA